jgi:hypothetical protein
MARRAFHANNYVCNAQGDSAALTNAQYQAIIGAALMAINIEEVYIAGMATASSLALVQLCRASTIASTPTTLASPNSDGWMNAQTFDHTSMPASYVAAATGPQKSATVSSAKLELGLNAFGGIVRWVAFPGGAWGQIGNTGILSTSILAGFSGSGAGPLNSHMIYEIL